MMLGDQYGQLPDRDPDAGPLSLDYYRTKAVQFQQVLSALDQAYQGTLAAVQSGALDKDSADDLTESLLEFDNRKTALRVTAEAVNLAAASINASGGRFPQLSIPGTLGVPFAVPVAMVGAVATAAVLISWGVAWINGVNDRLSRAQIIEAQSTPEQRAEVARGMAQTDAAVRAADSSPLSVIAPLLKYGAIALAAWLAYKAFRDR